MPIAASNISPEKLNILCNISPESWHPMKLKLHGHFPSQMFPCHFFCSFICHKHARIHTLTNACIPLNVTQYKKYCINFGLLLLQELLLQEKNVWIKMVLHVPKNPISLSYH